jgi:hypothetical protein
MYNTLRFFPTLYRRVLYNTVCVIDIFPFLYVVGTEIIPHLIMKPGTVPVATSHWQFITLVTLTTLVNFIPYGPLQPR